MYLKLFGVIFFCGIVMLLRTRNSEYSEVCNKENCDGSTANETRALSRSKRFLVFPDGSSFQLVFCVQTSALIPIGDIFLYGNTAALAWNLPTDPNFLQMFKKYEKNAIRRGDSGKNIYYLNEEGKVLARVPYKRPSIVNPAFAKRSIDETMSFREKLKVKIDRAKMHERQSKRDFLKKNHSDHDSIDFHRQSRVSLYEKLEPFITAFLVNVDALKQAYRSLVLHGLGGDGRRCVLYKLCESAKISARQDTFLQEILRVVFTLPKGREFDKEEHKGYDEAHVEHEHCASLYPGCEHFHSDVHNSN